MSCDTATSSLKVMPGRACPPHYRSRQSDLAAPPTIEVDTLHVAGGPYGTLGALDALEALVRADEQNGQRVAIILNGDFHRLDADPLWFAAVNRRVMYRTPIAGNIEFELLTPGGNAGCGCAYPAHVANEVARDSNNIIARLRETATQDERHKLLDLPRTVTARMGHVRILIIHGDTSSVAGWRFSAEHLPPKDAPLRRRLGVQRKTIPVRWLADTFQSSEVQIIACSHTYLPVFCRLTVNAVERALLNHFSRCGPKAAVRTRTTTNVSATSPPSALAKPFAITAERG